MDKKHKRKKNKTKRKNLKGKERPQQLLKN